jgi:hypothetical protein
VIFVSRKLVVIPVEDISPWLDANSAGGVENSKNFVSDFNAQSYFERLGYYGFFWQNKAYGEYVHLVLYSALGFSGRMSVTITNAIYGDPKHALPSEEVMKNFDPCFKNDNDAVLLVDKGVLDVLEKFCQRTGVEMEIADLPVLA